MVGDVVDVDARQYDERLLAAGGERTKRDVTQRTGASEARAERLEEHRDEAPLVGGAQLVEGLEVKDDHLRGVSVEERPHLDGGERHSQSSSQAHVMKALRKFAFVHL